MRLPIQTFTSGALLLALAGAAVAQNAAVGDVKQPSVSALRYRFTHTNDGIVRLDHQSGQVMLCKSQAGGKWACAGVPEDGAVLKAQLQQAEDDKGKLTEQLGELQKQLGMPPEERAALKAAIDKAQADSAAVKGELAALRQDIAALKQQLAINQAGDALKAEVARLQGENKELKDRISALQNETAAMQKKIAELEPPRPPEPAPKSGEFKVPQMPSKEELAQARAQIADVWRRVVEMLNNLRRDITGKDDDSVRL